MAVTILPAPMKNISPMGAKAARFAAALLLVGVCGCAVAPTASPRYIALLAPFEGRYREVGYQAFYAVRLALQEHTGGQEIALLAVDDGGSTEQAAVRAAALGHNSRVIAVLVLGNAAVNPAVAAAFGDVPALVAGTWSHEDTAPGLLSLLSLNGVDAATQLRYPADAGLTEIARMNAPITGGEMLALPQFAALRDDLRDITIVSRTALPDADFQMRYTAVDSFTPPPTILAVAAYDAATLIIETAAAVEAGSATTDDFAAALEAAVAGYQSEHPVRFFQYTTDGTLIPVNDVIEQR